MSKLTEHSMTHLREAGWHEGRAISTERFEQSNRESGLFVSPRSLAFLKEFGDLTLTYPNFRRPDIEDSCHFDAFLAAGSIDRETVSEYEVVVGKRLTVIGEAYHENMTLFMDEDGRVFGGIENTLLRFGDSGVEAINCLCEGWDPEEIEMSRTSVPPASNDVSLGEAALSALEAGGWTKKDVCERGLSKSNAFLAEYGGVSFSCHDKELGPDVCRIGDVSLTADYLEEFAEYSGVSGVHAVGQLDRSGMLLLMDEQGRMFGGIRETPEMVWFVGVSGEDAISRLVAGERLERI